MFTRTRAAAAIAIAAALMLAACTPTLTEGTVVGRDYKPAKTSTTTKSTTTKVNGKTKTKRTPVTKRTPAKWRIQIRDDGQTAWLDVSQGDYNRLAIGDHWPITR